MNTETTLKAENADAARYQRIERFGPAPTCDLCSREIVRVTNSVDRRVYCDACWASLTRPAPNRVTECPYKDATLGSLHLFDIVEDEQGERFQVLHDDAQGWYLSSLLHCMTLDFDDVGPVLLRRGCVDGPVGEGG